MDMEVELEEVTRALLDAASAFEAKTGLAMHVHVGYGKAELFTVGLPEGAASTVTIRPEKKSK